MSDGRKKSQFPSLTSVPNGAYFDFVSSGTNYRILDMDFYNALGITGTIVQKGDPTGIAILNKAGTVNEIRNIEAGSGVSASLSGFDGVQLSHNFTPNKDGVPVLTGELDPSPVIRSILAGSGMVVSPEGGGIRLSTSSIPVSSKTVGVSSLADLPDPVAGVITLLAETNYLFLDDINFGTTTLLLGDKTLITNSSSALVTLTYSGTGTFITSTDSTNVISCLTFNIPSGTFISWVDTTSTGRLVFDDVAMVGLNFGTLTGSSSASDASVVTTRLFRPELTGTGIKFAGGWGIIFLDAISGSSSADHFIDLGTAVSLSIVIDEILAVVGGGFATLKGAVGSANVAPGGLAVVSRINTVGTDLNGISPDDDSWLFDNNNTIRSTRSSGLVSMRSNATVTTISAANTPVLVEGTWVVVSSSQMTGTTGGRLTYDAPRDRILSVTASVTLEVVTGTDVCTIFIAKNGSVISDTGIRMFGDQGIPANVTNLWTGVVSEGDYFEVFVQNNEDDTDITVIDASLRVD
jgi:hypothetical protein